MSSSGLIYAVIVGAWAAYLVPMWLRRQDELNEARPTERFSTAIRLLSGRAAMERRVAKARGENVEPGSGDVEDDLDPADVVDVRGLAVPATEVRPVAGRDRTAGTGATRPDPRAQVLARRRRTTTLLFLAFTVGAVAAAVGGFGLLWAPAIPAALLTVYIGQMRRQERRRYEVRLDQRHAAEAARRLRARPDRARQERARAELPAVPAEEAAAPAPAVPTPSPRTADRRALVEQTDHAEWVDQQRAQQSADDGWDPVPVPLPTYVTAPVAPRTTDGVDLTAADTWSSARSGTTPTPEPTAPPAAPPARPRPRTTRTPLFDQYADPDRPRAANE
ncbi:hypothetical protein NMG29_04015 [Streptomyces cocklensis]|uniref:Uncharacterized protein n=1 Tax=Actinacidiphila cocklensis TaxID=887465 RepID=A0A9W4E1P6_9ACTN|nr:hypothetical protein [Actinacidiphila cocklensis]MDD1057394.1 hypothetical protein [Actinacidiphila cocklensis]CAG6399317.1 conserved hypothetical protein [Actinacidiphila cocklensis]